MEDQFTIHSSPSHPIFEGQHKNVDLQSEQVQRFVETSHGADHPMFALPTPQTPLPSQYAVNAQCSVQEEQQQSFHNHVMQMAVLPQGALPPQQHPGVSVLATNGPHVQGQHAALSETLTKAEYNQQLLAIDSGQYGQSELITPLPSPGGLISPPSQSDLNNSGMIQVSIGTAQPLHLSHNLVSQSISTAITEHHMIPTKSTQPMNGVEYNVASGPTLTHKPLTSYAHQPDQDLRPMHTGTQDHQQLQQQMIQNILYGQAGELSLQHPDVDRSVQQPHLSQIPPRFDVHTSLPHMTQQGQGNMHDQTGHAPAHHSTFQQMTAIPQASQADQGFLSSVMMVDAPQVSHDMVCNQPQGNAMLQHRDQFQLGSAGYGGMENTVSPAPVQQIQPEMIFINENMETQRQGKEHTQRDSAQTPNVGNSSNVESVTKTSEPMNCQKPRTSGNASHDKSNQSVSDNPIVSAKEFEGLSRDQLIARLMKLEQMKRDGCLQNSSQQSDTDGNHDTYVPSTATDDAASELDVGTSMNPDDDDDGPPSPTDHSRQRCISEDKDTDDLDEDEYEEGDSEHQEQEAATSLKPMRCLWKDCGDMCDDMKKLITHISDNHVGSGKPMYRCEWEGCPRNQKPFTKRHKMYNHLRTHTGERPFVCDKPGCGKRFSRPDSLTTHIKTHSNVRPYRCQTKGCHKAYYHLRSLKKHERTHEGEPTTVSSASVPPLSSLGPLSSVPTFANSVLYGFSNSIPTDFTMSNPALSMQQQMVNSQPQTVPPLFEANIAQQGQVITSVSHTHTSNPSPASIPPVTYNLSATPVITPDLMTDYKDHLHVQAGIAPFNGNGSMTVALQNYAVAYDPSSVASTAMSNGNLNPHQL